MEPYHSPDPFLPSAAEVTTTRNCDVGGSNQSGLCRSIMSAGQAVSRSPSRSLRGDGRRQDYANPSSSGGRFFGYHQPYDREYRSSPYSLQGRNTGVMVRGHNNGIIPTFDPAQGYTSARLGMPDVPSQRGRPDDANVAIERRDGNSSTEGARGFATFKPPYHYAPQRPIPTESTNTKSFRPFGSPPHAATKRNQPAGEATGTFATHGIIRSSQRPNSAPAPTAAYATSPEIRPYPHYDPRGPTVPVPTVNCPPRTLEASFSGYGPVPTRAAPVRTSDRHHSPKDHPDMNMLKLRREEMALVRTPEDDIPPLPALPTPAVLPQELQQPDHQKQEQKQQERQQTMKFQEQQEQKQVMGKQPTIRASMCRDTFAPMPLGIPSDSKYLTEFHCFLRRNLIEVFCANDGDINGTNISLQCSFREYFGVFVCCLLTMPTPLFSSRSFLRCCSPSPWKKEARLVWSGWGALHVMRHLGA